MARTKRTTQASPPTTEQGKEKNEQNKDTANISGEGAATFEIGSKHLDGNSTNSNVDKGKNSENPSQPATQQPSPTYTFKPPLGMSQEQINYKVFKIQSMFAYLTMDETYRMLDDCYYNEDEVTVRLITQSDYLSHIQDMLRNPTKICSTASADAPDDSSGNTTSTNGLSTLPSLQTVSDPDTTQSLQQQRDEYQTTSQLHDIHQYQQAQVSTTTGDLSSQLYAAPYQTQYPYYRSLQPSTFFPMSASETASTTTTTTTTITTTTTTVPPTAPSKRGSNYGKKYKKRKAINPLPPLPLPSMDDYASMPPTPIPSSSELPLNEPGGKKRIRSVGRLALDDALKQVKDNPMAQQQAYEGWSAARIRAYGLIETNPNTYYYRFNAPGEEQHKGAWTQAEKELFLKRVKEVGANSQWGIFSQAIPGRVGYQCSNFYRLLIETGELFDDNYVVDDKGKAHYLFDKKTATGEVQKTIRNHYKHKKNRDTDASSMTVKETKPAKKKKPKKRNPWDIDNDDDDDEYTGRPSKTMTGTRRSKRQSTST